MSISEDPLSRTERTASLNDVQHELHEDLDYDTSWNETIKSDVKRTIGNNGTTTWFRLYDYSMTEETWLCSTITYSLDDCR